MGRCLSGRFSNMIVFLLGWGHPNPQDNRNFKSELNRLLIPYKFSYTLGYLKLLCLCMIKLYSHQFLCDLHVIYLYLDNILLFWGLRCTHTSGEMSIFTDGKMVYMCTCTAMAIRESRIVLNTSV